MTIKYFLIAQHGEKYGMYAHPETKGFPAQDSIQEALDELTGGSEVQQKFMQVLFQNQVELRLTPLEMTDVSDTIVSALFREGDGTIPAFGIGQIEFMMLNPEVGKAWFEAGTRVSS